jgi:hypothetical protein
MTSPKLKRLKSALWAMRSATAAAPPPETAREHARLSGLVAVMDCGKSILAMQPVLPAEGGSIPTLPLQRLRKQEWVVAGCDQQLAEQLVKEEHYAKGASNTATYLHGLYPAGWYWYAECVGVAWWIPPTRSAAEAWAGDAWEGVLSLSRLAIMPDVPKNACSKSVRKIDRSRWHTLVTYADDWRGHDGAIYRACGWEYSGKTNPEAVYTINGRMTARKAGGRTRTHAEMLALGAVFHGRFAKSRYCLRCRDCRGTEWR